ncbi:MAG: hypothetical protein MZV63_04100 [Marinilabiliales bacterium]|nr:hypothetical protein [Marinilabiliales bacterium]
MQELKGRTPSFLHTNIRIHIAGMDDLRAFNYKSQSAIDIYAEERVQNAVRKKVWWSLQRTGTQCA